MNQYIISTHEPLKSALTRIDTLRGAALFVVDNAGRLVGSLTDGDVRRGILRGVSIEATVEAFMNPNCHALREGNFRLADVDALRQKDIRIIPILDQRGTVASVVNLHQQRSLLPLDAVLMAGGKGTRLRPLTLLTPKPLLRVGDKPIIAHNVEHLRRYGVQHLTLTVHYLADQLRAYFADGAAFDVRMDYIQETEPLGTIGSIALKTNWKHRHVLVMNSDLLTNIDYEAMFRQLETKDADMIVATTPYEVPIPYGIIETNNDQIVTLKEKPTYTYYANAGIYILKTEHIALIPKGKPFNATDLIELLIEKGKKVLHFPILGYWLDIGKPHDFEKAQRDIKQIKF